MDIDLVNVLDMYSSIVFNVIIIVGFCFMLVVVVKFFCIGYRNIVVFFLNVIVF